MTTKTLTTLNSSDKLDDSIEEEEKTMKKSAQTQKVSYIQLKTCNYVLQLLN